MSEFSPGPVGSDELLIRIIVAPQHIHPKKKTPKAGALADAERGGLSIFRNDQATNEEIRRVAEALVNRARKIHGEKAGVFGVIMMSCKVVRECRAENEVDPSFCVYDTGLSDMTSHSEAFQRIHNADDALREARRCALFNAVKDNFLDVFSFRDGLLSDLAPKST
ncbi:hypothetical protein V5F44_19380 [Xanthobacter sp. V2C-8]|uniref:hypothetical protein n=1 Tax=Xanthobacter albus TaxID=3119929 RepID=UPI003729984D